MKAFIIDDEQANREVLHILIQKYYPEITVIGESDNLNTFSISKVKLIYIGIH